MFWIRLQRFEFVALAILGLGVACSGPWEPEERSASISETAKVDSGKTATTPEAPDLSPPGVGVSADVPCSDYPVAGEAGPYRLVAESGIDPPKRIHFERLDVRSLGLKMSAIRGILWLEVLVSETGDVESVVVVKSAQPDFDRQAVKAIKATEFEPAMRRGEPVAVCMTYTVQPHL